MDNNNINVAEKADNILAYLWFVLGLVALIGVIFCGAWWHAFTAAICFLLYFEMRPKKGGRR